MQATAATRKPMSLHAAARWAERNGLLHDGCEPLMYAVDDCSWKATSILCLGTFEKCSRFMLAAGCEHGHSTSYATTRDGKLVRMYALAEVAEGMAEEEGEARCIPDACEVREWA